LAAGAALGVNSGVNPGVNTGVNHTASGNGSSDSAPGDCGSIAQAAAGAVSSKPPLPYKQQQPNASAFAAAAAGYGDGVISNGTGTLSDSAASVQDHSATADNGKQKQQQVFQQQQQQHMLLQSAVRAKSEGLLTKQDFVTRVLTVPSNSSALQQVCMLKYPQFVTICLIATSLGKGCVRRDMWFVLC
jgi:hypothetical protein